ncbi:MAG: ribonuclease III [Clostridia bacterium]|nr:ribonuclease III [Clostridia bacterium]
MNFDLTEKNLGYVFKDKQLLKRALTLPSACKSYNNQTLEFFGDAILEFIVSEQLFDKSADEGELTDRRKAIVSDKALEPVSRRLGLDEALYKGNGDDNNKKAVPSAYEAVVAAIYLDGGMAAAKKFVLNTLDFSVTDDDPNYKGGLQEWLQSRGKEKPVYPKVQNVGTAQKPWFKTEIKVEGNVFKGCGATKKQAEQNAAKAAVEWIKEQGL